VSLKFLVTRLGGRQRIETRKPPALHRRGVLAAAEPDFDPGGTAAAMAWPNTWPSAAYTPPRRQRRQDLPELGKVLRHGRVGDRQRCAGHAHPLCRQRQRVGVEVVVRQDRDRALRRQAAQRQRLADPAHAVEHPCIADRDPLPVGSALRHLHPIGHLLRPLLEPVDQAGGVGPQRLGRAQPMHAVRIDAVPQVQAAADAHRAVAGRGRA
jgi:hypothetical protein